MADYSSMVIGERTHIELFAMFGEPGHIVKNGMEIRKFHLFVLSSLDDWLPKSCTLKPVFILLIKLDVEMFDHKKNPEHLKWMHRLISNLKAFVLGTFHGSGFPSITKLIE